VPYAQIMAVSKVLSTMAPTGPPTASGNITVGERSTPSNSMPCKGLPSAASVHSWPQSYDASGYDWGFSRLAGRRA